MNRITTTFERLRSEGRKALVAFLSAGDPDFERSEQTIRDVLDAGVDVLELGVPFSDPTADGPTIQAASRRALAAGATIPHVLRLVERVRADYDAPIVLFGYANPFFRYGYKQICNQAAGAGADGFLIVDLPHEEMPEITGFIQDAGLCLIPLVAPTTGLDRMRRILATSTGFIYYILVAGVTGARAQMVTGIADHTAQIRQCSDVPVVVGFGISTGTQARQAAEAADGVVVGSALIEAATRGGAGPLAREIREALDG